MLHHGGVITDPPPRPAAGEAGQDLGFDRAEPEHLGGLGDLVARLAEQDPGLGIGEQAHGEFGAMRNATRQGKFFGENFRKANQFGMSGDFEKTFSKRIKVNAGIGFKMNEMDFDFGASERYPRVSPAALLRDSRLDPGPGFRFSYSVGMDLQPVDALSMELKYRREKLTRNDNKLTAFDSNIYSLKSTYQFTRFIFARARVDYETIDGTINSQLLFGWSPNPGTAFYLGYNDNSNYRAYNDYRNQFDTGFRQDGRRFFIRMSYLFRKSI